MATGKTLWNVDLTVTAPGTEIAAGLPNLQGWFGRTTYGESDGKLFSTENKETDEGQGGSGEDYYVDFNASRCNPIYGNSETVQPPAIAVTMWQRTA
jgi:hypothetical protein